MSAASESWESANQRELMAALAVVRAHVARSLGMDVEENETKDSRKKKSAAPCETASALATLCAAFGLSAFERDVLLLCAALDLDTHFASLLARANGDVRCVSPTFGLALAALPGARWSAIASDAPLRHWRLIEIGAGESLTISPLRIDERVLHFLAGTGGLDERLTGILLPVPLPPLLTQLQRAAAEALGRAWAADAASLAQFCGDSRGDQAGIAAAAASALGWRLLRLRPADIPAAAPEREVLARLLEREAVFSRIALIVDAHDADPPEIARAVALLEMLRCPVAVAAREPLSGLARASMRVSVAHATEPEQRALWNAALGPFAAKLNGRADGLLDEIARQFRFDTREIVATAGGVCARLSQAPDADAAGAALWADCRATARARLDGFAQRIDPAARWDDLVLPAPQSAAVREIAAQVRQRYRVYETWGFSKKGARGLGVSALFTGPSGTGKTMAAEVLANELRLDLWRIDLSAVVSKYIGETEKNLRRVFDAAEAGGAILLFDEADALFGKRSEVKDSHDRYANIEVGYLLQRMEAYRGLAILTTNLKGALDTAFLRRLRFVVQFPFPDAAQRAEIWRRIFPAAAPTRGLDAEKLARLGVAGGNIRNIALNAAFLAADAGEDVRMKHLLRAVRTECAKIERPPTEAEIGGWEDEP